MKRLSRCVLECSASGRRQRKRETQCQDTQYPNLGGKGRCEPWGGRESRNGSRAGKHFGSENVTRFGAASGVFSLLLDWLFSISRELDAECAHHADGAVSFSARFPFPLLGCQRLENLDDCQRPWDLGILEQSMCLQSSRHCWFLELSLKRRHIFFPTVFPTETLIFFPTVFPQ